MSKENLRKFGQWEETRSSSGKVYYYNATSEISQWDKPQEWKDFDQQEQDKLNAMNPISVMPPPPLMHPSMGFIGMPPPSQHYMPYPPHPPGFPPNFPGFYPGHNPAMFAPPPPPKTNTNALHFSSSVPPPPMGHPSSRSHNNGVPPPPPPVQPPTNEMYLPHSGHDNATTSSSTGVVPPPPPPSEQSMHSSYSQNRNRDHDHLRSPSTSNSNKAGENSMYKREIANLHKNGSQASGSNKRLTSPTQRPNEPPRKKTNEELNKNSATKQPSTVSDQEPSTSAAAVKPKDQNQHMTDEMKKLYDPAMAIEKMKELGLYDEDLRKEFRKFTKEHIPSEAELNFELATRECTRTMSAMTAHHLEMSKDQLERIAMVIKELSDHRPGKVTSFSEIIEMTAK